MAALARDGLARKAVCDPRPRPVSKLDGAGARDDRSWDSSGLVDGPRWIVKRPGGMGSRGGEDPNGSVEAARCAEIGRPPADHFKLPCLMTEAVASRAGMSFVRCTFVKNIWLLRGTWGWPLFGPLGAQQQHPSKRWWRLRPSVGDRGQF
jgi:hypothetical protein